MYKNYDLHDIINGNKSKSNLHITAKKTMKLLNPRAIWLKVVLQIFCIGEDFD